MITTLFTSAIVLLSYLPHRSGPAWQFRYVTREFKSAYFKLAISLQTVKELAILCNQLSVAAIGNFLITVAFVNRHAYLIVTIHGVSNKFQKNSANAMKVLY